jgi:hypothetical protein
MFRRTLAHYLYRFKEMFFTMNLYFKGFSGVREIFSRGLPIL